MAEFYGEIRVLIGYRVGVMGSLSTAATECEPVKGNFAFKDCWLGLEVRLFSQMFAGLFFERRSSLLISSFVILWPQWVRDNIHSFGGDASRIDISGLSAGAHVCHQMLLHAARLSPAPVSSFLIPKRFPSSTHRSISLNFFHSSSRLLSKPPSSNPTPFSPILPSPTPPTPPSSSSSALE